MYTTFGFLTFSGGIEMEYWDKMDYLTSLILGFTTFLKVSFKNLIAGLQQIWLMRQLTFGVDILNDNKCLKFVFVNPLVPGVH